MSETGKELQENNEQIVYFLNLLRNQRREIDFLIDKQEEEKNRLEMEIERIYYKLTLICKSLATRKKARVYYDQTIKELEEHYRKIVESSGVLLNSVKMGAGQLEQIMDKKIGTGSLDGDDSVGGSIIPGPSRYEEPTKDSNAARPKEPPGAQPPDREQSPAKPQKKKKYPQSPQPPPIMEEPSREQQDQVEQPSSFSVIDSACSPDGNGPPASGASQVSPSALMSDASSKQSGQKESVSSGYSSKKESVASGSKKSSVSDRKSEDNKSGDRNSSQTPSPNDEGGDEARRRTTSVDGGQETYLVVEKFHESDNDTLYDQDSLEGGKKGSKESMLSISSHSLSGQDGDDAKVKKKTRVSKTQIMQKKQVEHEIMVRVDPGTTADTEDVVVLKKPAGQDNNFESTEEINADSVQDDTTAAADTDQGSLGSQYHDIKNQEKDHEVEIFKQGYHQQHQKKGSTPQLFRRSNKNETVTKKK